VAVTDEIEQGAQAAIKTADEVPAAPAIGAYGTPQDVMTTARILEQQCTGLDGLITWRFWRGSFYNWTGSHWRETLDSDLDAKLWRVTEKARYWGETASGKPTLKAWAPSTTKISNLRGALAAVLNTVGDTEQGSWLDGRDGPRLVACGNVLVDPLTALTEEHTAAYFNGFALDFDYDKDAQCPVWLGFLESVWPGDPDSRLLLQQWFGYVLSGRTDLQKLMYMKGLKRSGKGTIARILTSLLGQRSVVGPDFESFGRDFGLELMTDAALAVVGDARYTGDQRVMQSAISKLLSITGEDKININRKYKTTWSGTLPTRLMLMSNEMPWFKDSSGAIVDRMLLLVFKESFIGREDLTLDLRLHAELAGIFNWALEGYRELVAADGHFTVPRASERVLGGFRETVSPIEAWLRAECTQEAEAYKESVPCLRHHWERWCADNGYKPGAVNVFLSAVQTVWPNVDRTDNKISDGAGRRVRAWSGIRYAGVREDE